MQMILLLCLLGLILCLSLSMTYALSTTQDGKFQAIAQSPDTIQLYWKQEGSSPVLICDGMACSEILRQPDPVTGFASVTIGDLQPNTAHTFSLGAEGPSVSEKTWSRVPESADFDVLVVGATASGVAAAVTAARLGQNVALVEETNRVGGMSSNGLASTDIRDISRSNGFFEDFRRRIVDFHGQGNGLRYEPRVANAVIKQMLHEHDNICLFLRSRAVEPIMEGNRVTGALVRDLASGRSGRFTAKVTIDATDTGDFAAAAGARFVVGREARSNDEPHAGVIYFDDARQDILPGSTGLADCKQQSYAYLMIWKDYGDANAPAIEMPPHYDPENYRYSPPWDLTWNATFGNLPNGKFEINQHPFGIDWPGINHDYPTAGEERRREIECLYRNRALGYLYYMQNEQGHRNLGLADDEFLDNGGFPVSLYVREARRLVGCRAFAESDVTNARQFNRPDAIAIGDYPMDSHAVEELKDPNALHKGEGEEWLTGFTPWYQAPYWVLIPEGIDGLLVSTAVSATHVGYGTLRMEPVRMSLGQAAGAAAYWSVVYGKQPREINPAWVQDKLLSQYAYIHWNSDVDRDTRHFKAINFLTARGFFSGEAFRPDEPLTARDAFNALSLMPRLEGCPQGMQMTPAASLDEPITRGAFAVWLVRAKQKTSRWWDWTAPECPAYADVPRESPYYMAVETLRAHRITSSLFEGYEQGLFKPDLPITRADAAEAIFLAHRVMAMNGWKR